MNLRSKSFRAWPAASRFGVFATCFACSAAAVADESPLARGDIRAAATKSIALIEKSTAEYLEHRECFSCHHQAMGVIALSTARNQGFKIDEENFKKQIQRTKTHLERGKENYLKGRGQGGRADTAGYALWTLADGEYAPDDVTAAVTEYLVERDKNVGHWRRSGNRPPSEASHVTTTALALRGLRDFGTALQAERITVRNEKGLEWFLRSKPADTEDRVFRLNGLAYLDADQEDLAAAAKDLLTQQREDGGWAQTDDLESDAYATGSALVALARYGNLATTDAEYRRGLNFCSIPKSLTGRGM